MLWFFKSFFPVLWIAFLLYWRIKAAGTKTTQRSEPDAAGIVRALVFLIVIVLLSLPRIRLANSTATSPSLRSISPDAARSQVAVQDARRQPLAQADCLPVRPLS